MASAIIQIKNKKFGKNREDMEALDFTARPIPSVSLAHLSLVMRSTNTRVIGPAMCNSHPDRFRVLSSLGSNTRFDVLEVSFFERSQSSPFSLPFSPVLMIGK
jgi:hypothetical protein